VICIVVLGASRSTYDEVPWTQSLPDWISAPVRALAAIGGVLELVGPDNLNAVVYCLLLVDLGRGLYVL
jgi:transposase